MNKEKFDIPLELDAKILDYASKKKYRVFKWDKTFFVKAAAVFLVVASAFYFRISLENDTAESNASVNIAANKVLPRTPAESAEAASVAAADVSNWNEFEERLEYVNDEIIDEIKYLAQL